VIAATCLTSPDESAIRDRLAKLAAERRHVEREIVAWQLADYIMRGPQGFNPHRRPFYAVVVDKMATAALEDSSRARRWG